MEDSKKKKSPESPATTSEMQEVKSEPPGEKPKGDAETSKVKTESKQSANSGSDDSSGEVDEATMRRALQDYMAMAQTVQSAQQMALATSLIQAYGPQAMAYLQAAAVTGKPLASMLSSLAILQQAQQQQQQAQVQQAAASAAALSMLPKRGRGSRGGSVARRGSGVALKLKRLDS